MIDDDIGHRLDSVLEQCLERGLMFVEGAVAVIESKVLFRVIAGARVARVRGRRQPDQVEAAALMAGARLCTITYQCLSP